MGPQHQGAEPACSELGVMSMTHAKTITTCLAGIVLALLVVGMVLLLPPYVCGWIPNYPLLERARYYWSPKAQFLRCNMVLHEIAAAKDTYELENDNVPQDVPLTAEKISISREALDGTAFRCPSGGRYTVNPPGLHPVCSIHGDSLGWEEGQPYPTRAKPAPVPVVQVQAVVPLSPEDRIDVPPLDEGSGID